MEERISWELVNPEGTVQLKPFEMKPHPGSLEGKTVLLRWNGKHNGDVFLNEIAARLTQNVKNVKIIRSWEVAPETMESSSNPERSKEFARKLGAYKPDIVIGSQAD